MIEVFYQVVKAGKLSIEKVPKSIRAEVQALLDADND